MVLGNARVNDHIVSDKMNNLIVSEMKNIIKTWLDGTIIQSSTKFVHFYFHKYDGFKINARLSQKHKIQGYVWDSPELISILYIYQKIISN